MRAIKKLGFPSTKPEVTAGLKTSNQKVCPTAPLESWSLKMKVRKRKGHPFFLVGLKLRLSRRSPRPRDKGHFKT